MKSVVRINSYEMTVKRRVMDLGEQQAIWDYRLAKFRVCVGDYVGGVEQASFGNAGQGTSFFVSSENRFTELSLMNPPFNHLKGVTSLLWGRGLGNFIPAVIGCVETYPCFF